MTRTRIRILAMLLIAVGSVTHAAESNLIEPDSIKGWKVEKEGRWSVEDGVLSGEKDAKIAHHCLLVSEEAFSDFRLEMEYLAIKGNSGFYVRLQPADNGVGYAGYHVEIDSKGSNAGGLFDVAVKWLVKPDPALAKKAFKPGEWNHMVIEAQGQKIVTTLNGVQMVSHKGDRAFSGKLGIQLHANENTKIKFRNMRITEKK